jgi:copper chaperone CopZ
VLILFALYSMVQKFRGKSKSSCCGTGEVKNTNKVADTNESHYPNRYILYINGMHCSNCARTAENALNGIRGVWASVDLGKSQALVRSKQEYTEQDFAAVLKRVGYQVTGLEKA